MNSITVHARTPAIYCHFTNYLGILIPSAALLLKNGIRKAGNLLQDFLLGGAADRQRVFSFESSGQVGPMMGYFTTQNSYLKSKRTLS